MVKVELLEVKALLGIVYNQLIHDLYQIKILLNQKILAQIAILDKFCLSAMVQSSHKNISRKGTSPSKFINSPRKGSNKEQILYRKLMNQFLLLRKGDGAKIRARLIAIVG